MGWVLRVLLLGGGLFAGLVLATEVGVLALGPWVQAPPPGAKVLAGYLLLRNEGDRAQSLVAVSSPDFERVEIHRTVLRGEVAHMEAAKELALPPRASVELKPGGWHLMLIGPKKTWKPGESIALRLQLKSGDTLQLEAPVRGASKAGHDSAGQAHHAH